MFTADTDFNFALWSALRDAEPGQVVSRLLEVLESGGQNTEDRDTFRDHVRLVECVSGNQLCGKIIHLNRILDMSSSD